MPFNNIRPKDAIPRRGRKEKETKDIFFSPPSPVVFNFDSAATPSPTPKKRSGGSHAYIYWAFQRLKTAHSPTAKNRGWVFHIRARKKSKGISSTRDRTHGFQYAFCEPQKCPTLIFLFRCEFIPGKLSKLFNWSLES